MFIRAIKSPHSSQQRLGFLKYLISKVSLNDSTPLNILGEDFNKTVSKKINVTLDNSLKEYIKNRFRENEKNISEKTYIEIQDLYLSDPKIPSKTGKLYISDALKRYPYLLSSLGFAREKIYSPLVMGKILLSFISKDELNSFSTYSPNFNPLILNDYQKYLFLYSIIENDGDVIKPLYSQLLNLENPITDWSAGDYLPEIYQKIAEDYTSKITNGIDRERIKSLVKSANRIQVWKDKKRTGGRVAKIDAITPRLELFVDLGMLAKTDPYKYEYFLTPKGKEFFESFSKEKDIDDFLQNRFFSAVIKSFKLQANYAIEEEILSVLMDAYNKLKSPVGYAPIKDIALLGIIKSLVEQNKIFEIGDATKLIFHYQKENPDKIRFQPDRYGNPSNVKFIDNEVRRIKNGIS